MPSHEAPNTYLAQLAPQSVATWHAIGAQAFPGGLHVATDNSCYRFRDGVFVGRAIKSGGSFHAPEAMEGLRLIGFLHDEGGLWSLSPRRRRGAHAVLWKPGAQGAPAFILTSPIEEVTPEDPPRKPVDPGPPPQPWVGRSPASHSRLEVRRNARPPSTRQPLPPSTTRIHNAEPSGTPR